MSGWVCATNGRFSIVASLPAHLIHQRLELINIFKTPVHAGKADVGDLGDLGELFQFLHYQLPRPLEATSRRPRLSSFPSICSTAASTYSVLIGRLRRVERLKFCCTLNS